VHVADEVVDALLAGAGAVLAGPGQEAWTTRRWTG
jgi:hypothetical protein